MPNYYLLLSTLYPDGSIQGQCGVFCHRLMDFPLVGDTLASKIAAVKKYGYTASQLLGGYDAGDIVITKENQLNGHVAFVNNIVGDNLQLTESNFHEDLKVHHTRLINKNSPELVGCIRGKLLFLPPDGEKKNLSFPIQLKVLILQNNQPFWNSLLKHMANLQNWFWFNSQGKIQLIIDYRQTTLKGWNTVFTGPVIGGLNVEVIDPNWFDKNVLPAAPLADIVIFNMPRKDWKGSVFDHPESIELGYTYEPSYPVKIMTVSDEFDDYPPYYPTLGAFAKVMAHEIAHGLYGIAAGSNVVPGGDYCHNHFYGQNGYPIKPEDIFGDFDYQKLADKIKN